MYINDSITIMKTMFAWFFPPFFAWLNPSLISAFSSILLDLSYCITIVAQNPTILGQIHNSLLKSLVFMAVCEFLLKKTQYTNAIKSLKSLIYMVYAWFRTMNSRRKKHRKSTSMLHPCLKEADSQCSATSDSHHGTQVVIVSFDLTH